MIEVGVRHEEFLKRKKETLKRQFQYMLEFPITNDFDWKIKQLRNELYDYPDDIKAELFLIDDIIARNLNEPIKALQRINLCLGHLWQ